jgi:phosphate starvation-inducible PhoH-like protein
VVGGIEGLSFIRFDDRDVVRHKLVQQIVKAYEAFDNTSRAEHDGPRSSASAADIGVGREPVEPRAS